MSGDDRLSAGMRVAFNPNSGRSQRTRRTRSKPRELSTNVASAIAGIELRLDPGRFARIHRSDIVNLGRIASIEPIDTGDARLHLHDGEALPCKSRLSGRVARPGGRGPNGLKWTAPC